MEKDRERTKEWDRKEREWKRGTIRVVSLMSKTRELIPFRATCLAEELCQLLTSQFKLSVWDKKNRPGGNPKNRNLVLKEDLIIPKFLDNTLLQFRLNYCELLW